MNTTSAPAFASPSARAVSESPTVVEIPGTRDLFTPPLLDFLAVLHRRFRDQRARVLAGRAARSARLLAGGSLEFPYRDRRSAVLGDWAVAETPPDLLDRRVEIAGPVSPRIAVNALNSGAQIWIADLEDATTPSWRNLVRGYGALVDAVYGRLDHVGPDGRQYRVNEKTATIVVRPRGWHLDECHVLVDGEPVAASLVDFGVYFFHCAKVLLCNGSGPYLYLAKIEDRAEARLWDDIFCFAQDAIGVPVGSIRATVIIETITAAFEMPEILHTMRRHAAGLTAGRWDYLFSIIKNFRNRPDFVLPDRGAVTMSAPFLKAYADLLVDTCHRHGAHAIGGVAAVVPTRGDPTGTRRAFAAVRSDKTREAAEGFDGAWVVHPDLVATCAAPFTAAFGGRPHQIGRTAPDPRVTVDDLLAVGLTPGAVTADGVRSNVAVSLRYLTEWLGGNGSARIFGMMEGLATVEIARSQLWQWIRHGTRLGDGTVVSPEMFRTVLAEEERTYRASRGRPGADADLDTAIRLFEQVALSGEFCEFLTELAYPQLVAQENLGA
jgi:malate synthase